MIKNKYLPNIDKSMAYYLLEIESSSIDKDSYSSGQPVEFYITLFEQSVISYLIGPIKTFLTIHLMNNQLRKFNTIKEIPNIIDS